MKTYSRFAILIISMLCVCCSIPKDLTPDAHPNAKAYTSVINTVNMGNSAAANIVDSVKAGSEVVKLRLDVTASAPVQHVYIVYATDNGTFQPMPVPTTTNEYGTFIGGNANTYSLKVPKLTSFVLDIFVSVRNTNTALNDVYKIWVTDTLGSFTMPDYNRKLGTATVNLMYKTASLPATYTAATFFMGSQSSRNYGSLLSTGAQIASMDSVAYTMSPGSADVRLVTLTSGKKDNNSIGLWLYSPADVALANPAVSGQTNFVLPTTDPSKTTKFGAYTGTVLFDEVKTAELIALPAPTEKSIEVAQGGTYIFETQEGKKGLIKINSTAVANSIGGTGSSTGQNINASVKILN